MPLDQFTVICLCADWCDTCRKYRSGFENVMARFPRMQSVWLDIEDQADALGDLDIESFPTLLISRDESILYYGVMLPYPEHLSRILENFLELDASQTRVYANSDAVRQSWQGDTDFRRLLALGSR